MSVVIGHGNPAPQLTVFGGLRLHHGAVEAEFGSLRQREIFALLIAARGEVVAIADLTDALWPTDPPSSAVNQIHRHVGELRRLLEPGLPPRSVGRFLHASGRGYRVERAGLESDIEGFYALSAAAEKSNDEQEARWLAVQALEVAALPAFRDLPSEILANPSIARLDHDRWTTALTALRLTRTRDDAEGLLLLADRVASEAPLEEPLQAELIRVFALTGRRAQALELFERTRLLLADELGIDPSEELSAARMEVLRDTAGPAPVTATQMPHALPMGVASYVDRAELRLVLEDLTQSARAAGAIAVVSGMGGVGKTTSAVHWARSVMNDFPDGQLYVNMRGYDASGVSLSSEDAIDRFLEQLGSDVSAESAAARHSQFRSLVAGKRLVVLIDNARDPDQVRPLLPDTPGCLTIVTSRDQLSSLIVREGARSVPLQRWGFDESRELLIGRLGAEVVDASSDAIESIIESCAGLPLALAIAAARSILRPSSSMPAMARELVSRKTVLDSLSTGASDDVRSTFEWSYRALRPETARFFRQIAAHPGPQMSLQSLASCALRETAEVRRLAGELVAANMVIAVERDTIELHDLLRAFAAELLDDSGEREVAERRLIEHYVRSVRHAFLQFGRPPTVELGLTEDEPSSIESFTSIDESLAWYSRERSVLHAMIRKAVDAGLDREAALIALDWRPMNQTLDSVSSSIETCKVAYAAAQRTGDITLIGDLARDVGGKLSRLGDPEGATEHTLEALRCFEALGDDAGEANALRNLAGNAERAGDVAGARNFAKRAVEAARRSGHLDTLALALAAYASLLPADSEPNVQLEVILEASSMAATAGLEYLRDFLKLHAAFNALDRREFERARDSALEAGDLSSDPSRDPSLFALVHEALAYSCMHLGDPEQVRRSLDVYDGLIVQFGLAIQEANSGAWDYRPGRIDEARAWLAKQSSTADGAT